MRKIEREVITAFINRESKSVKNTSTDGQTLFLHMNMIAQWDKHNINWTMCGWDTVTTRSRLNALFTLLGSGDAVFRIKGQTHKATPDGDVPIDDDEVSTINAAACRFFIEAGIK